MSNADWTRSSFCHEYGCVDVRLFPNGYAHIRSTRKPGVVLVFDRSEWEAFLAGVRNGEFDPPGIGAR